MAVIRTRWSPRIPPPVPGPRLGGAHRSAESRNIPRDGEPVEPLAAKPVANLLPRLTGFVASLAERRHGMRDALK